MRTSADRTSIRVLSLAPSANAVTSLYVLALRRRERPTDPTLAAGQSPRTRSTSERPSGTRPEARSGTDRTAPAGQQVAVRLADHLASSRPARENRRAPSAHPLRKLLTDAAANRPPRLARQARRAADSWSRWRCA